MRTFPGQNWGDVCTESRMPHRIRNQQENWPGKVRSAYFSRAKLGERVHRISDASSDKKSARKLAWKSTWCVLFQASFLVLATAVRSNRQISTSSAELLSKMRDLVYCPIAGHRRSLQKSRILRAQTPREPEKRRSGRKHVSRSGSRRLVARKNPGLSSPCACCCLLFVSRGRLHLQPSATVARNGVSSDKVLSLRLFRAICVRLCFGSYSG